MLWSLQEGDGLLLLEEPELSLNAAIISQIPQLISNLQRPKKRQVILTSHSLDILKDRGIALEEIILLEPNQEGTQIRSAAKIPEIKKMLEGGMTPGDAILPRTKPKFINQLPINF